jgi:hypothetical protein
MADTVDVKRSDASCCVARPTYQSSKCIPVCTPAPSGRRPRFLRAGATQPERPCSLSCAGERATAPRPEPAIWYFKCLDLPYSLLLSPLPLIEYHQKGPPAMAPAAPTAASTGAPTIRQHRQSTYSCTHTQLHPPTAAPTYSCTHTQLHPHTAAPTQMGAPAGAPMNAPSSAPTNAPTNVPSRRGSPFASHSTTHWQGILLRTANPHRVPQLLHWPRERVFSSLERANHTP